MRKEETKLSDVEEQGYRGWLSKIGQAPGMGGLDKTWTHKSYDLRGVYKKYGPVDIRKTKVPDEFKKSEDLSKGPEDTQNNWAKGTSENTGSHETAPWYSNAESDSSFGNNMPWDIDKNG